MGARQTGIARRGIRLEHQRMGIVGGDRAFFGWVWYTRLGMLRMTRQTHGTVP